ncbi:MAG: hypothetical protein KAI34_07900, partial [Candidatus Lokiarchaeota archaeon]|nr:hypothetical protein [Candidatus Lokiarchaeota archaeon]
MKKIAKIAGSSAKSLSGDILIIGSTGIGMSHLARFINILIKKQIEAIRDPRIKLMANFYVSAEDLLEKIPIKYEPIEEKHVEEERPVKEKRPLEDLMNKINQILEKKSKEKQPQEKVFVEDEHLEEETLSEALFDEDNELERKLLSNDFMFKLEEILEKQFKDTVEVEQAE